MSFSVERDESEKPDPEDIDPKDTVGLDLGVLNFIHDSDGRSINRFDLSDDRERLEREQRSLSRKEYESNNWHKQRQRVAEVHMDMRNKKRDYKHKLAQAYTMTYDAVFVEDLNVKSILEGDGNARNKAEVGWRDFIRILKHHGRKHGCHVVEVKPAGTTKECASCGVETAKPLWVREHSCPACDFELDRDFNAFVRLRLTGSKIASDFATSLNVLSRGLAELGVGHSEATPVETATAVDTVSVSASRVVESGSPCLKEPPTAASRQG